MLSMRDITGSARYVGMSGAMTAIGGDPSAAFDNPASLGVYTGMEAHMVLDLQVDQVRPTDASQWCDNRTYFIPSLATAIFSLQTMHKEFTNSSETSVTYEDVPYLRHVFMIGFRRQKNYSRFSNTLVEDRQVDFSGFPFRQQIYEVSDESGYVNDFGFNYALSIRDRWFVGVGLDIYDFRYGKDMRYDREYYDLAEYPYSEYPVNTLPLGATDYYDDFASSLSLRGVGASLRIGAMARPVSFLSLGLSFQTPSVSSLRQYDNRDYQTDDMLIPERLLKGSATVNRSGFHMPMHTSAAVAFHALRYATLSFQYDWTGFRGIRDMHLLKAGVEFTPIPQLSIQLGTAYESPFRNLDSDYLMDAMADDRPNMLSPNRYERMEGKRSDYDYRYINHGYYISGGIGYMGKYVQALIAYQYRRQDVTLVPNVYTAADGTFDHTDIFHSLTADTHRVVISIGLRR